MNNAREDFLERVRRAVSSGNKPGAAGTPPARGKVGYQGGGADAVAHFTREFQAAGGKVHVVDSTDDLLNMLGEIVRPLGDRILLECPAFLAEFDLEQQLRQLGRIVQAVTQLESSTCRDQFFAADVGITGVEYLIAEPAAVVVASRPDRPRSTSLLPPVHIALARREQLLPDLFDLFSASALLKLTASPALPSCVTLITGPSKTGDIELRLVTGVHGPGEVHVVICTWT
jgi:L-lactate utilization protein LutC